MGVFWRVGVERLKQALAKTREGMMGRIVRLVSPRSRLDEAGLEQLEESLIASDMGVDAAMHIVDVVRSRTGKDMPDDAVQLNKLIRDEIERLLPPAGDPGLHKPHIILVVGINGVGKTTTIGKLAYLFAQEGKRVLIGASDTFRAAANEQLEIWAQRAGVSIIHQQQGSDPAAVAFDTVKSSAARGADVVIIDTAGRLHTKVNLMEELKKIKRVIQKHDPLAPHEVLLVIDASTGQNGIAQAREFASAVGVTGLVLTKLDGTAKGGIVVAIGREMNIPVRFIGIGEQIDDLQSFNAREFVDALFE